MIPHSDPLLDTAEAASFLRLSTRQMERHRQLHTGPVFIREGRRVYYSLSDLTQWQDDNRHI
jgi:Helix-turn-helix domain